MEPIKHTLTKPGQYHTEEETLKATIPNTFVMVVEMTDSQGGFQAILGHGADGPPDVILTSGGEVYRKSGRYMSEGNRYRYHRASTMTLAFDLEG